MNALAKTGVLVALLIAVSIGLRLQAHRKARLEQDLSRAALCSSSAAAPETKETSSFKNRSSAQAPDSGNAESRRERRKRLEGILKNPAVIRFALSRAEQSFHKQMKDFFKRIDEKKVAEMKKLFRQFVESEIGLSMQLETGELTKEQRADILAQQGELKDNWEKSVREALGPEDFARLEEYAETMEERSQVEAVRERMYGAGLDLSDAQVEALVKMMAEARKAVPSQEEDPEFWTLSASLPEERLAMGVTEQEMRLRWREFHQNHCLAAASGILSDSQTEILKQFFDDQIGVGEAALEYKPPTTPISNNEATATVANVETPISSPVTITAASSKPQQWGDISHGSRTDILADDGTLSVNVSPGSGWGTGLTFWPKHSSMNKDNSANAAGATRMVARINAPAGAKLRFGLLESGVDWPQASRFRSEGNADGEAYRHEGIMTREGWQIYEIPLSQLKLNGGYGNQTGNRRIDTDAIKGIEVLVPGGQTDFNCQIDYIKLQ